MTFYKAVTDEKDANQRIADLEKYIKSKDKPVVLKGNPVYEEWGHQELKKGESFGEKFSQEYRDFCVAFDRILKLRAVKELELLTKGDDRVLSKLLKRNNCQSYFQMESSKLKTTSSLIFQEKMDQRKPTRKEFTKRFHLPSLI